MPEIDKSAQNLRGGTKKDKSTVSIGFDVCLIQYFFQPWMPLKTQAALEKVTLEMEKIWSCLEIFFKIYWVFSTRFGESILSSSATKD